MGATGTLGRSRSRWSRIRNSEEPNGRRIAVLTGASGGIGEGITESLKAADVVVVGISRTEAAATDRWIRCDVSDPEQVDSAVQQVKDVYGRIDILVNAAGFAQGASLTETSVALWCETIDVNLTGTFLMMRRVVPDMACRRWGRIVNVASIAASQGEPRMAAFAAATCGVLGLTRSVAHQVAKSGITVNAICAGMVEAGRLDSVAPARGVDQAFETTGLRHHRACSTRPHWRVMEVWEVADLVAFLVSDDARGISGQGIDLCDGVVCG